MVRDSVWRRWCLYRTSHTHTGRHTALKEYALTAAMRDARFAPVRAEELPTLACAVSLLTDFEPAAHWEDWEVYVCGCSSSGRSHVALPFKLMLDWEAWRTHIFP